MKRNQREYTRLAFEEYNNAKICVKCYSLKKICVHHKDWNPWNNKEKNLQILCSSCHTSYHSKNRTEETLLKIWLSAKWRLKSKNTREKLRLVNLWENNPMYWKIPWNKWRQVWPNKKRNTWKLLNWLWCTAWVEKTWKSKSTFYKLTRQLWI